MSDIKLQKNIETELEKDDCFNTKPKADLIKSFIESYSSTLEESKIMESGGRENHLYWNILKINWETHLLKKYFLIHGNMKMI